MKIGNIYFNPQLTILQLIERTSRITNIIFARKKQEEILLQNILIGQQAGYKLENWIKISKENNRISVLLSNSPYVKFLEEVQKNPKILKDKKALMKTPYYLMAKTAANTVGHYMNASSDEEIFSVMNSFYDFFLATKNNKNKNKSPAGKGHSKKDSLPIVTKIKYSNLYEIVDGHHRLAIDHVLGKKHSKVIVYGEKLSYLQQLLLSIKQIHGRELYQPINKPETQNWNVVRNCKDRFDMMQNFLKKQEIKEGTVLDLACSYGWFISQFKNNKYTVLGIDKDPTALKIAQIVHKLSPQETKCTTVEDYILKGEKHDIVLFLSILHHYGVGKENAAVKDILKKLDKVTKKILFIDSGQNHEKLFTSRLPQWDTDYIINLIKQNTSFKNIYILGVDKDNRGKYKDSYGRTLFACSK